MAVPDLHDLDPARLYFQENLLAADRHFSTPFFGTHKRGFVVIRSTALRLALVGSGGHTAGAVAVGLRA